MKEILVKLATDASFREQFNANPEAFRVEYGLSQSDLAVLSEEPVRMNKPTPKPNRRYSW